MNDADKGLASKKPNHQGHTLLLNSQFLQGGNFSYISSFVYSSQPIKSYKPFAKSPRLFWTLYNLTLSEAMFHTVSMKGFLSLTHSTAHAGRFPDLRLVRPEVCPFAAAFKAAHLFW